MSSERHHTSVPQKRSIPLHGLLGLVAEMAEVEVYGGIRARGFGDIRPGHGCVFGNIEPDGSRLTDLATRAGYTKQTVGDVVSELEEMGYVERVPDPEDRRAKIIRLTARGREAQSVGRGLIADMEKRWARQYGKARMADLRALLEDVVAQAEARDLAA